MRVRASKTQAERWLLYERSAEDVRKFYLLNLPATVPLKDPSRLVEEREAAAKLGVTDLFSVRDDY